MTNLTASTINRFQLESAINELRDLINDHLISSAQLGRDDAIGSVAHANREHDDEKIRRVHHRLGVVKGLLPTRDSRFIAQRVELLLSEFLEINDETFCYGFDIYAEV